MEQVQSGKDFGIPLFRSFDFSKIISEFYDKYMGTPMPEDNLIKKAQEELSENGFPVLDKDSLFAYMDFLSFSQSGEKYRREKFFGSEDFDYPSVLDVRLDDGTTKSAPIEYVRYKKPVTETMVLEKIVGKPEVIQEKKPEAEKEQEKPSKKKPKKKATEEEKKKLKLVKGITNEKVRKIIDENKIEKEKTSLYSQLYKKFRKVIYAGTTAVLLGVLGYCGVSGTYESLSQRPQIQPQVRTAQIQEQAKPLEKIVVGKEGKSKVFFYEGTDVKIPGTVEYKIQKGDRLWSLAEALGISQANIPRFVNELVEKQTDYENSESFLEKISKDTIYVSNGKILHGSDGIKGDSLDVGDSFYIDESLINKYGGDFEKVKELGNLIVKEEPKQKQTQKVKQVSEKKQPKQEQKESKETVGLYMPNQEKPFGVFQRDFANDAEKYYENLSGQDIEQKACSYSTHLSIELPAAETQRVTENYIKARLGKNMNMDVMEAYSLLDNLKVEEKRQFVKDFELDYEKATNNIYDMYKQGKNMEQIVNDAEYSWVDEELVRHVVAY